jgi:hypothetical protein
VQAEGAVSFHEIVDVDHVPGAESIFAQPFHEGLQLVARFEVRRGQHLIFDDDQMFVGVELAGDRQFGDGQT